MSPLPAPCSAMRYEAIDTRSDRVFVDRNIRRAQTRNRTRAQWPGAAASRACRPASAQDIQMRRYRIRARESADVPPAAWGSKPLPQTPPFRRSVRVLLCMSSILRRYRVKAADDPTCSGVGFVLQSKRKMIRHRLCLHLKSRGKTYFALQSNLIPGSVQPTFRFASHCHQFLNRDMGQHFMVFKTLVEWAFNMSGAGSGRLNQTCRVTLSVDESTSPFRQRQFPRGSGAPRLRNRHPDNERTHI